MRKQHRISTIIAVALTVLAVGLGIAAMIISNPFLGLFAITVVCAGAVSALVGLQD